MLVSVISVVAVITAAEFKTGVLLKNTSFNAPIAYWRGLVLWLMPALGKPSISPSPRRSMIWASCLEFRLSFGIFTRSVLDLRPAWCLRPRYQQSSRRKQQGQECLPDWCFAVQRTQNRPALRRRVQVALAQV